ncbi:hypothetical protein NEOLI_000208 [Neolecta irregularis DAH-3]|uniref:Uncharacterized protein n=1 Tax=Neolecta irregularis (strain DAH-3) TaxID=1198029 RepID=A0A1U7LK26_NEOID|nr:hypothetical protein NEOLI_000208 [Neolecta irregularis DAH-3]|eukprot:OLL22902.1 hypothetical protein NEOLI_000208 [Neolecta irregularis DAH-3]
MQLSSILGILLPAMVLADQASPSPSPPSALTKCVDKCGSTNLVCIANCVGVPAPNADQVNATNTCVTKCPQGSGTAADTQKYSDCVQQCISHNYFSVDSTQVKVSGSSNTDAAAAVAPTPTSIAPIDSSSSGSGTSSNSSTQSISSGTATSGSSATGTSSPTPTHKNGVSQRKVESALLLLAGSMVLLV